MPNICIICNKNDANLLLQCDGCKKFIHASCSMIDTDDAKRLTRQRSKGIKFFCSNCDNVLDHFSEIKTILATICNRLEKLESYTESVTPILFEKIVAETKERVQRDNNVIVYGLNENQDDGTAASCIINAIAPTENYADRIVHTMRLGRLEG